MTSAETCIYRTRISYRAGDQEVDRYGIRDEFKGISEYLSLTICPDVCQVCWDRLEGLHQS